MIRVRDLKVWFPLRRGLARELTGGGALWVRAVDGVSFDVNRGEVYCLVGESGCGKTTTGKALVSLVDATEGDVLLEMPNRAHAAYEKAKARPEDPAAAGRLESLRRKYSITWKERLSWKPEDYLAATALIGASLFLGVGASVLVLGLGAISYSSQSAFIAAAVLIGLVMGFLSALPPVRPDRRLSTLVGLLAVLGLNLVPMVQGVVSPYLLSGTLTIDPMGALATAWGQDTFGLLVGLFLSLILAAGISRLIISTRQESEGLRGLKMRTLRRRMHLIFQDPYESLNPKQSVYEIVEEPLKVNHVSSNPDEISALVRHSLEDAGLRPADEFIFRFPHELSGGQRQRVSVAAALVLQPDFIVADEPVSMLDVSIRTEILQLMMQLRKERDLTYLFITHDLGLAWILADRISVMYLGKIVESGTAEQVIGHPKHPYTQALISVVPSPDPRHEVNRTILKGERPDPVDIPAGCRFHPRCPLAFEMCGWEASEVVSALQEAQGAIASQLAATIGERKEAAEPGSLVDVSNLESARAAALALQGAFAAADPRTVVVQPPPGTSAEDLAERLRGLVASQRDQRLALKGIADIRLEPGRVVIPLHPWSEPLLVEVAPGNEVACHLIRAPAMVPPPVAPIPAAGAA